MDKYSKIKQLFEQNRDEEIEKLKETNALYLDIFNN